MSLTTAGFLTWAGYSSIAAIALVVSFLLQAHEKTASSGPLTLFWEVLISTGDKGELGIMPFLALGVSLFVFLPILIELEPRFRHWIRGKSTKRTAKSRSTKNSDHLGQMWPDLPALAMPQLSSRHDGQIQSFLPAGFLILSLVIFFRWQQVGAAEDLGRRLSVSASSLYVAFAIVLMTSTLGVLYASLVLLPRLAGLSEPGPSADDSTKTATSAPRWLTLFWEIPASLAVGVAAVSVLSVLPAGPSWDRIGWGLVAMFLMVSSIFFGLGIALKGLFKDFERLEKTRINIAHKLAELESRPSLSLRFSEYYLASDPSATIGGVGRKTLDDLLLAVTRLRSAHTLSSLYDSDEDPDSLDLQLWKTVRETCIERGASKSQEKKIDLPWNSRQKEAAEGKSQSRNSIHSIDYVASTDLMEQINNKIHEIQEIKTELVSLQEQLEGEVSQIELFSISENRKERRTLEGDLSILHLESMNNLMAVERKLKIDETAARTAFMLGAAVRADERSPLESLTRLDLGKEAPIFTRSTPETVTSHQTESLDGPNEENENASQTDNLSTPE